MPTPKVVVAAITRYNSVNETRCKLACKTARKISAAGHTVVFNDDSPDEVRKVLKEAGAKVFTYSVKGTGAGRRESIVRAMLHASGPNDVIIMTEPEKDDLARWIPKIIEPIVRGTADIVLTSRSEMSWRSFPWFQMEEEKISNSVYRELFGLNSDILLGPTPFRASFHRYFTECRPSDYGVADNYINVVAPILASFDGVRIQSVEIDFIYPTEQKAEEEGLRFAEMVKKCLWQQKQLIETFFTLSKIQRS